MYAITYAFPESKMAITQITRMEHEQQNLADISLKLA